MLSIGRTASYAVSALSRLAELDQDWVLLPDLVAATDAPAPYLSKILNNLARAGLIRAKRGYKGGYALVRPAGNLSVREIIEAVEGPDSLCECLLGREFCTDERACPAHEFWKTERARIRELLESLTLESVARFELRRKPLPVIFRPGSAPGPGTPQTSPRSTRGNGRRGDNPLSLKKKRKVGRPRKKKVDSHVGTNRKGRRPGRARP